MLEIIPAILTNDVEELKEIGISEEQAQALITAAQQFMTLPEDVDQKTETVGEGTTER